MQVILEIWTSCRKCNESIFPVILVGSSFGEVRFGVHVLKADGRRILSADGEWAVPLYMCWLAPIGLLGFRESLANPLTPHIVPTGHNLLGIAMKRLLMLTGFVVQLTSITTAFFFLLFFTTQTGSKLEASAPARCDRTLLICQYLMFSHAPRRDQTQIGQARHTQFVCP